MTFCLLTGESQAGKSTVVNCIMGRSVAAVGNGGGQSVTVNTSVYSTPHGLDLMDCPGGLDTNLRSDKEILQEIEYAITKKSNKTSIDAILLAESLTSDTMQLTRNLQRLQTAFGAAVMQSIVVLGTKPSSSRALFGDNRINMISAECKRLGLNFVLFETYSDHQNKTMVNGAALTNQLTALKTKIGQIKGYEMSSVAQIRQQLRQDAQRLMNSEPTKYETKYYTETYSEPYTQQESYQAQEQYTENEIYTVQIPYPELENYIENVWDVVDKDHNVFKWGKKPKKIWGWRAVQRQRWVTKHRAQQQTRPVTKYRTVTKYRNVTKYATKSRQKATQIAIPKDFNVFMNRAMTEWEEKVKQSLKRKVLFV